LQLVLAIRCRYYIFRDYIDDIERKEPGGMDGFTKAYQTFGIHVKPDGSVVWREWCPGARELRAYGDFSKYVWYLLCSVSQKLPIPSFNDPVKNELILIIFDVQQLQEI